MAHPANRRSSVPGLVPGLGWAAVRVSGHQPHRAANGLCLSERHPTEPILSSGRPLAGRPPHQLLLLRPIYDGPANAVSRHTFQCGLQSGPLAGPRPGWNSVFWPGLQPDTLIRRRRQDSNWLWVDRSAFDNADRQSGRSNGVRPFAGLGRRRLLAMGGHQGTGRRSNRRFRRLPRRRLVVVAGDPGY